MREETYKNCLLQAAPKKIPGGRWQVGVTISRTGHDESSTFLAEDGISYILEIEAAEEGLNLGRRLVDRNRIF